MTGDNKHQGLYLSVLLAASTAIVVAINYLLLFKNAFHGLDISAEGMYLLSVRIAEEPKFALQ
jgi:hypothetical protein